MHNSGLGHDQYHQFHVELAEMVVADQEHHQADQDHDHRLEKVHDLIAGIFRTTFIPIHLSVL